MNILVNTVRTHLAIVHERQNLPTWFGKMESFCGKLGQQGMIVYSNDPILFIRMAIFHFQSI